MEYRLQSMYNHMAERLLLHTPWLGRYLPSVQEVGPVQIQIDPSSLRFTQYLGEDRPWNCIWWLEKS